MMLVDSRSSHLNPELFVTPATAEDKRAIEQKQGVLWECTGRTFHRDGYIYHYRWRGLSQRRVNAALSKVYPAIENDLLKFESLWKDGNDLEKFGYRFTNENGCYLDLPDKDFLQARLKEFYPDFAEAIGSSNGAAGDLSFTRAFLEYFFLISEGEQFVHDHSSHAIVMLRHLLRSPEQLVQAIKNWRTLIKEVLCKVESAENLKPELKKRVMTMVASTVDRVWASSKFSTNQMTIERFEQISIAAWDHERYHYYWTKTYGEKIDAAKAQALWDEAFPRA